jgi:electron transport complex protein RnfG
MYRHILTSTLLLTLFALIGTAGVAYVFDQTEERIAANERAALLASLTEIVPSQAYDNDIVHDVIELEVEDLNPAGTITAYRARRNGTPSAVVLTVVAPDGYSGPIKLLVGIYADGRVAGVRVISHRETPGLGDGIDARRSDWIRAFSGRSLGDPPPGEWAVERDGGAFDQFTGATITPRAVVKAVKRTLVYFDAHREALFAEPGPSPEPSNDG